MYRIHSLQQYPATAITLVSTLSPCVLLVLTLKLIMQPCFTWTKVLMPSKKYNIWAHVYWLYEISQEWEYVVWARFDSRTWCCGVSGVVCVISHEYWYRSFLKGYTYQCWITFDGDKHNESTTDHCIVIQSSHKVFGVEKDGYKNAWNQHYDPPRQFAVFQLVYLFTFIHSTVVKERALISYSRTITT